MAIGDKNEPVDLVVVEPCVVEGKHLALGAVLKKQDPEFAFEMAACGKMRLWTKELESDMKARAKAEEDAKESRASQGMATATLVASTASGLSADELKAVIDASIAKGIQAGMQAVAEQLAAAPEETPSAGNAENSAESDKAK